MNDRDIKRQLKREAAKLQPDVLRQVYERLDLAPLPKKKWYLSIKNLTFIGAGATALLVFALILPALLPDPIVSDAETFVRLQMIPASIANPEPEPAPEIKYLPPTAATPVFSYKVSQRGKTEPIIKEKRNAVYAENEASKLIAAGVGLANTKNREPEDLALALVKSARRGGYIESYLKGNVIAYRLSGADEAYASTLKERIRTTLENYFQDELIYAVVVEDETLEPADFSTYEDFSDEEYIYRGMYDNRRNEHADDDDQRGPNWGDDLDEWMDDHRGGCCSSGTSHNTSMPHGDDDDDTSTPGSDTGNTGDTGMPHNRR